MRTTLEIPNELILEAKAVSGLKTKTDAVIIALEEFIQRRKSRKILELKGSLKQDISYKEFRRKR